MYLLDRLSNLHNTQENHLSPFSLVSKVISYAIPLNPLVLEFATTRNQLCNTLVFEDYRTVIALAPP